MTGEQRRIFTDAQQLYETISSWYDKSRSCQGGMHWKTSKGRQYLFRTVDRYGNGRSLGPRSPETEQILERFRQNKATIKDRLSNLKTRLKEQSRFCKAARINRVSKIVTGILRVMDRKGMLGTNVLVIGTNAMFAYEAAAGVFINSSIVATRDMDILWDVRPKLKLAIDRDSDITGLMGILRNVDRSFEPLNSGGFRAANRDGYLVDLIKVKPIPLFKKERQQMGDENDLKAVELPSMQWLISSPKFNQVVIGEDGYPAPMVAPDPRAFSIHKMWLSEQVDREPVKKKRDRAQGLAAYYLTDQYLPHYQFRSHALRMFPKPTVKAIIDKLETKDDLPAGFDFD